MSDIEVLPIIEQFYSIQGEGYNMGKAAYFIRIAGCDIGCSWCDTKSSWNNNKEWLVKITDIVNNVNSFPSKAVVVTGGEPLNYNLDNLCDLLKQSGISTFLETSGTHKLTGNWDWICFSPKKHSQPLNEFYLHANELKVIISDISDFKWAEECSLKVNKNCILYLQPEWSNFGKIIAQIVEFIKKNPKWKISLQAHKFMHIQ